MLFKYSVKSSITHLFHYDTIIQSYHDQHNSIIAD